MKKCEYILGNSSSGIVEAASFGKSVINLGSRQNGKLIPSNVINCKFNNYLINKAITKIENENYKKKINRINPYGNGNSGKIIGNYLSKLKIKEKFFQKKFITK